MEDPAIMPPKPDNGKAWLFWCFSTIALPAFAGGSCYLGEVGRVIAPVLGFAAIIIHLASSMNLGSLRGCAVFFIFFGGWALMLASFFVGCVAFFPKL